MELGNTYDRAIQFTKNFSKHHPGMSNLYVFTSVDKDGNIVDEKYGMNLMTNIGFRAIYANGTAFQASDSFKLFVGTDTSESSTSPYTVDETQLREPAFGGTAATFTTTSDEFYPVNGTTKAYNYPMYFEPGEQHPAGSDGFITLISRFAVAYYDYNVSGYPNNVDITEYGMGTAWNNIWTHSRIYDIQGQRGRMTKTSNERLYITVYMCLSFYESIIMNGWANNRFAMITTNALMYDRMGWSTRIKVYKRGNRMTDITDGGTTSGYGTQRTLDTSQSNAYTLSTTQPQLLLYDAAATPSDAATRNATNISMSAAYIDGFILSESGFICVDPQFLTEPEDINLINYESGDVTKYSGFADKFGVFPSSSYSAATYPQMTHFFNANAWVADVKNPGANDPWTCKLDIYNPDSKWYDDTPSQTQGGLPIYYSNNDTIMTAYVYQNLRPDDKIIGITGGGVTIYATNRYWATAPENNTDPNLGWVWIRDYTNIPANCQSARYWITNTISDSLAFVRESDCFQLLEKGTNSNGYADYLAYTQEYYIAPICDNYQYGWYKRGNKVYVPSLQRTYTVGSDDDECMTYGKWLVVFKSANNEIIRVDMTDAVNGTVTPETVTIPFNGTVNMLTQTHRTESGTGIICIEATNVDETVTLDLRNNGFIMTQHSWKHACTIWGTNKVGYINATSGDDNVYIYNFDTASVEGNPIPFPSGISDIPHLFGHTNFIWMTNGSSFGYVCDLRTPSVRNPEGFDYAGLYGTDLHKVKYTCVDEVFIVYKSSECGSDQIKLAHYVALNNPTHPLPMTPFNANISADYIGGRIDFVLRYANPYTLNSVSHAGLVLLINRGWWNNGTVPNGADCRVIDFGQYLYDATVKVKVVISADRNVGNLCMYGENIIYKYTKKIPLINFLPIKLTGKTDTINAMQYIKNITGKSWLIAFTNTPSWGDGTARPSGKPPGTPLAKTNRYGEITGWS